MPRCLSLNRFRLTPTPSRSAGRASAIDHHDPRVGTPLALGLIGAFYAMGFLARIESGIWVTPRIPGLVIDYSTQPQVALIFNDVGQITGTLAALYLIGQWLGIPPALAGTPGRRAAVAPGAVTAALSVAGTVAGQMMLYLLNHGSDTNGHYVVNGWLWLAVVSSIAAGIVEETTIVAIPVLLGRRAGWHPAVIIALSVLLRYPFHVYHGPVTVVPWVIIWAGTNAAAYLYLRRLWPLVIVHAGFDIALSIGGALGGGWLGAFMVGLFILGTCVVGVRFVLQIRRETPSSGSEHPLTADLGEG